LDGDEPEFPEEDGPVFAVGGCALVDAVWATVGEDSLGDVLGVLLPVLDDAVPGLDGQVTADALIAALPPSIAASSPVTPKCWSASTTTTATPCGTSSSPGPFRPQTSFR